MQNDGDNDNDDDDDNNNNDDMSTLLYTLSLRIVLFFANCGAI